MNEARFLRVAAACSALSAVTTLLLIFLPDFFIDAQGFEARMARVREPACILRSWVYLVHPFLVLTAALGILFVIRRASPVLAISYPAIQPPGRFLLGLWLWRTATSTPTTIP